MVIAGRPNVGKSTLFNKLAGRRSAIVSDTPGVTRDRKEAEALLRGRRVRLVDTAGLEESAPETHGWPHARLLGSGGGGRPMWSCSWSTRAAAPAGRRAFRGLAAPARAADPAGGEQGRREVGAASALEAYALGLGEPLAVSAEHGEGLSDLMTEIADRLPGSR